MNLDLERFLDSIEFDGRLACDGTVQRYGHKRNKWVWSIERDGNTFITAGDWSTGEKVHFGRMTHVIQRAIRQQRTEDAAKHAEAADVAKRQWDQCDAKPTGRTYLERKGVAGFGVRYRGVNVVVPMRRNGDLVGLQTITPTGEKRFTRGCSKRGAYHVIGSYLPGVSAVLCEGYATGASIHMATLRQTVVAFDCGNLMPVATGTKIDIGFVAADNDATPGNPGLTHACTAAAQIGARVVCPKSKGMDWNDVHAAAGLAAVRGAFA